MSEQKSDLLCNKLAITISPYDDELFSSWIFRLALANAIEPYYLHKFVTNNARSWNMDLDVARDEDIIDCYCLKPGIVKVKYANCSCMICLNDWQLKKRIKLTPGG